MSAPALPAAPAPVALATAEAAPAVVAEPPSELIIDEPVEEEPTPPEPAPEPAPHVVTVTVEGPSSALVRRDGQLLGRAPQQVSFTERAEVSVEAPGYTTRTTQLDTSSPAMLALRLEPVAQAATPQPDRVPASKATRVSATPPSATTAVVVPNPKETPSGAGEEADWVDVKPTAKAAKKPKPKVDVPIF